MSTQEQTVRAFVAVELPEEIRGLLALRQEELRAAMGRMSGAVRWARPEGVHLTLQFLGDVHVPMLGKIEAAMREGCVDARPLHLVLSGVGAFPSVMKPRVLWIGLEGDIGRLQTLQAAIENRLKSLGYKQDKPFQPHITLGRVRDTVRPDELRAISQALLAQEKRTVAPTPFTATSVSLMQSNLQTGGAVYTQLACVMFD